MLVLSRKAGEGILLQVDGHEIFIAITEGKAKVGISADQNVRIVRSELLEREGKDVRPKLSNNRVTKTSRTRAGRWNMPPLQSDVESNRSQDKTA